MSFPVANATAGLVLLLVTGTAHSVAMPVADANGPYTFDASHLTISLDGSGSTDPDNDIVAYDWLVGSTSLSGATPSLDIAQSGLATTTSVPATATLTVTDAAMLSDSTTASLLYLNEVPFVASAAGSENADLSISFDVSFGDPDLTVNSVVSGFEDLVNYELLYGATSFLSGGLASDGLNWLKNVDRMTLDSVFGGPGTFTVEALARDRAGATGRFLFDVSLSRVPAVDASAPANTILLLVLGLVAMGFARSRRNTD